MSGFINETFGSVIFNSTNKTNIIDLNTQDYEDTRLRLFSIIMLVVLSIALFGIFIALNCILWDDYCYNRQHSNSFNRTNNTLSTINNKVSDSDFNNIEFVSLESIVIDKLFDTCSICLENVNLDNAYVLDCEHVFHKQCLNSWIENSQKKSFTQCPNCRNEIKRIRE